jgi:hypothetical protein
MSLRGYGLDRYGLDPYGAEPSGLAISNAFASGIRVVRVTLSREPLHVSNTGTGDALNPKTWTVQRLDNMKFSTVIQVTESDPPLTFDIAVLEKFADQTITYQLKTTSLVSTEGEPITFAGSTFNFVGVKAFEDQTDRIVANRRAAIRDLANPPAPNATELGGTLQIVGGDYAMVEGADLLKKLILRRLVTRPGEFSHLPDYGVGLAVKEPMPTSSVSRLQKTIKEQVLKEPEVDAAEVTVTVDAFNHIVLVTIRARLKKTGQEINMPFRVNPDAVVSL